MACLFFLGINILEAFLSTSEIIYKGLRELEKKVYKSHSPPVYGEPASIQLSQCWPMVII